jgi:iron complex outermembrane receptor protein
MVYTLVNLGFGGKVTVGKTIFNVNLNGITCSIKDTLLINLKNDGISNIGRNIVLGVNFNCK